VVQNHRKGSDARTVSHRRDAGDTPRGAIPQGERKQDSVPNGVDMPIGGHETDGGGWGLRRDNEIDSEGSAQDLGTRMTLPVPHLKRKGRGRSWSLGNESVGNK
jgi:hypothetical protein